MKSSFVTALSLVGVIGAGSAAALVNTSIFDSTPDAVEAAFVPGAAVVELTLPKAASSSGSLSVKEAVTTTVAPTQTTVAPPPEQPSLLTRYDLGGSGSVTVDVLDGKVTLIDATAAAGWTVIKSEFDAVANQVEIELSDGSMVVDFEVGYVAGVLVPDIRTESVSNGHHDDHEDDDDDHDEHEDDDDEHEDDHDEHDEHDDDHDEHDD